jgi:SAM-dependent methyltransferase
LGSHKISTGIGVADAGRNAQIHRSHWKEGLQSEIAFWNEWIRTGGLQWPEDFVWRTNPSSALQPHLAALLNAPRGSRVRILDVGAGPLTILGKVSDSCELEITAVDPLADAYNSLLGTYSLTPPIRTLPCEAENLSSRFEENYFDLVHARNCLDHSYDPVGAFRQMIAVVKPGHWLHAAHAANEGCRGEYNGLHQWNFDLQNGHFVIWNPETRTDMNMELQGLGEIEARLQDDWIFVNFRKL